MIEKNNLQSRVQMLGFQPYSVLIEHAYKNHIFLSPSVSAEDGDTEGGAPVTITEMIATGIPVISTMHCDIPEVINYGRERMLSPERAPDSLFSCIQWWLQHTDSWTNLLRHARKHIENEYDVYAQAISLGRIYRELIESHQPI